jgi:hypothetical protein
MYFITHSVGVGYCISYCLALSLHFDSPSRRLKASLLLIAKHSGSSAVWRSLFSAANGMIIPIVICLQKMTYGLAVYYS